MSQEQACSNMLELNKHLLIRVEVKKKKRIWECTYIAVMELFVLVIYEFYY